LGGIAVRDRKYLRQNALYSAKLSGVADAGERYFRKSANFMTIRFDLIAYNKVTWCWLAALDLSRLAA
jgi:hypothetical protein